jgi:hypothetical protein
MTEADRPPGIGGDLAALWAAWLRPWGIHAPLSGDVTQDIETSLVRSLSDQLGLVNISLTGAGDPALERRIVEDVASYGRQLGRVLDALDVLIRHASPAEYPPDDRRALDALRSLREEVEGVKRRAASAELDRLVDGVRALRRDPEANRAALDRLEDALRGA